MLTKVTIYGPSAAVSPLILPLANIPDTDLFEIRNIDGLEPVKAAISTSQFAVVDGEFFSGSSVGKRNIVLTLGLRADWVDWTPANLRRKLDSYFMPKSNVTLIFEGDEQAPVVISGYVESNEPSIFSKDPENVVSIICPDPAFVTVDPIEIVGDSTTPVTIDYQGTVESGIYLEITKASGSDPSDILVSLSGGTKQFKINAALPSTKKRELSSVDRNKYVQDVVLSSGVVTSLLTYVDETLREWPKLQPGQQDFSVVGDTGVQNWTLTYYERYGSL